MGRKKQHSELHIFNPESEEAMKVTLTRTAAGPQGVALPGTVLDMKEAEAKAAIEDRSAREFDPARDAKAKRGWRPAPRGEK